MQAQSQFDVRKNEEPVVFTCRGSQLVGIVHHSQSPADLGVIIVVGGPQYRVGSHRQFLLLARDLATKGFPTLRFDYRGMGDSDGSFLGFESIEEDIGAAIDALQSTLPQIKRVVLWGLCDGATAASMYAPYDARVAGLILLNPWIRSEQTLAKSLFFHYYVARFFDLSAWRKLLTQRAALKKAVESFIAVAASALGVSRRHEAADMKSSHANQRVAFAGAAPREPLLPRVAKSLERFKGSILLILSAADITANEFAEGMASEKRLRKRLNLANVRRHRLENADHTFSRREWRNTVSVWSSDWLSNLPQHK